MSSPYRCRIIFLYMIVNILIIHMISANIKNNSPFLNKNDFPNRSIYFTSLKDGFTTNTKELELEKPHNTDTMIIKIEKNIPDFEIAEIDSKNFLSLQIARSHFRIMGCLSIQNQNEKQNVKHQIPKKLRKFFSNFVEISDENNLCYLKEDYLEFDFRNLSSKNEKENFTNSRNPLYTNLNILNDKSSQRKEKESKNSKIKIEDIIDINLVEYTEAIESFTSEYLNWNQNCYFELVFTYDAKKEFKKFNLKKIFIYFSYPNKIESKSYYISMIKNGKEIFDDIFIYYRNSNKILKYSKQVDDLNTEREFAISGADNFSIEDYNEDITNNIFKITTKRDESIYHNTLTIHLDNNYLENKIRSIIKNTYTNNLNEICFHIFQPLTEDTYIEKNEFRKFVKARHAIYDTTFKNFEDKFKIFYSNFIDQELSSDLTDPYFLSFIICESLENLKHLNYEISYPVHFRYQPALEDNSVKFHQNAVMPLPYVDIFVNNNTNTNLNFNTILNVGKTVFDKIFYDLNILNKSDYYYALKKSKDQDSTHKGFEIKYDEKKLFKDEIYRKLKFNVGHFNNFIYNRDRLIHQVPAGKMDHFMIVLIITVIVTLLGFMIIAYGLLVFLSNTKSKNFIERELKQKNYDLKKEN